MERKNELKEIENIISHAKEFEIIEHNTQFTYIRLIYILKNSQNLQIVKLYLF